MDGTFYHRHRSPEKPRKCYCVWLASLNCILGLQVHVKGMNTLARICFQAVEQCGCLCASAPVLCNALQGCAGLHTYIWNFRIHQAVDTCVLTKSLAREDLHNSLYGPYRFHNGLSQGHRDRTEPVQNPLEKLYNPYNPLTWSLLNRTLYSRVVRVVQFLQQVLSRVLYGLCDRDRDRGRCTKRPASGAPGGIDLRCS